MLLPEQLKYRQSHEWVQVRGEIGRVGVTDHAQQELNDVVFVDLPEVDKELTAGEAACVIESTKVAADVYAPLSGTVTAVNTALENDPGKVNSSPYEEGWLFEIKMSDPAELNELLSAKQYKELLQG